MASGQVCKWQVCIWLWSVSDRATFGHKQVVPMKNLNRPVGCGIWMVWLLPALFAAEWLLLWLAVRLIPQERLLPAVMIVVIATIVVGCSLVYFRVQRKR